MSCSPLKVNRRFGRTYLVQLQSRRIIQTRNQHEAKSSGSHCLLTFNRFNGVISQKTRFFITTSDEILNSMCCFFFCQTLNSEITMGRCGVLAFSGSNRESLQTHTLNSDFMTTFHTSLHVGVQILGYLLFRTAIKSPLKWGTEVTFRPLILILPYNWIRFLMYLMTKRT
jgi:hypothetical protein